MFSLCDNQFRVLSCKVFRKNTTRSEAEAWRFFRKPEGLDLAGQKDTELPLHNESEGGLIIVCVKDCNGNNEDVKIYCNFAGVLLLQSVTVSKDICIRSSVD